jgi:hypothetical protein
LQFFTLLGDGGINFTAVPERTFFSKKSAVAKKKEFKFEKGRLQVVLSRFHHCRHSEGCVAEIVLYWTALGKATGSC